MTTKSKQHSPTKTTLFAMLLGALLASAPAAPAADTPVAAPSASQVARRALVIASVHTLRFNPTNPRGILPLVRKSLERDRLRTIRWLEENDLWSATTEWERRVLNTPVGGLGHTDVERVNRLRPRLETYLYALGVIESLPIPDGTTVPEAVYFAHLPRTRDAVARFVERARFAPTPSLAAMRQLHELWLLRSIIKENRDHGRFPHVADLGGFARDLRTLALRTGLGPRATRDGGNFYRELVRVTAHWAWRAGFAGAPVNDDLPVLGKAFADLDAKEHGQIRAVVEERVRAQRWLRGEDAETSPVDATLTPAVVSPDHRALRRPRA
jgi:hypothetical protein